MSNKDLNKIILIGRLGNDPVQRETKSGVPVVHFSLATSRKRRDTGDGTFDEERPLIEETVWHRVVVWGRQAENCAQYLKKGQTVYVEGSIRTHKYDDKEGIKRWAFEVYADNIGFLGGGRRPSAETDNSVTDESMTPIAV